MLSPSRGIQQWENDPGRWYTQRGLEEGRVYTTINKSDGAFLTVPMETVLVDGGIRQTVY